MAPPTPECGDSAVPPGFPGWTDGRILCSGPGVDDAESECGLDQGVTFDWVVTNDGDELALDEQLETLLRWLRDQL